MHIQLNVLLFLLKICFNLIQQAATVQETKVSNTFIVCMQEKL